MLKSPCPGGDWHVLTRPFISDARVRVGHRNSASVSQKNFPDRRGVQHAADVAGVLWSSQIRG